MENKKDTNFINMGTYRAEEADILKSELEKHGIPVKIVYPGTGIGKELTAQAYFTAYRLMIRTSDLKFAEKIRKKFNIEPIKLGEKMPLPKPYDWIKQDLINRFLIIGCLVSLFGILITGYLSYLLRGNTSLYSIVASSFFWFFGISIIVYNIFRKK